MMLKNRQEKKNRERTSHTILSPNYCRQIEEVPCDRVARLSEINTIFEIGIVYMLKLH